MYRNKLLLVHERNNNLLTFFLHEPTLACSLHEPSLAQPKKHVLTKSLVQLSTVLWMKKAMINKNMHYICKGKMLNGIYKGAGSVAKCDHRRIGVRARVRANLDLDVRGACVRRKKQSQLTPCCFGTTNSVL